MADNGRQSGRIYGFAQTALLCVFAGAVFFGPGTLLLLPSVIPGVVGAVLCGAGLVLLFAALGWIGRAVQISPEPRPGATLVTTGVYKWLRHPIYTSIVVVVVGIFLRRPTLVIGIAGVVVIAFLVIKVRFEEKLLVERYPTYSEYKMRTWGIIPWPRRSSSRS
jgi:protein-S-isoprenylcysteine O-methyltransferase Ste14